MISAEFCRSPHLPIFIFILIYHLKNRGLSNACRASTYGPQLICKASYKVKYPMELLWKHLRSSCSLNIHKPNSIHITFGSISLRIIPAILSPYLSTSLWHFGLQRATCNFSQVSSKAFLTSSFKQRTLTQLVFTCLSLHLIYLRGIFMHTFLS